MSRDAKIAASPSPQDEFRELHRNFPDLIERLRLRAMGAKANRQEITMALHAEAADAIEELCAALSEERQLRWQLRSRLDAALPRGPIAIPVEESDDELDLLY